MMENLGRLRRIFGRGFQGTSASPGKMRYSAEHLPVPMPLTGHPTMVRVWTSIAPAVVKARLEPEWPNPFLNDTRGIIVLDVAA